MIWRSYQKRLDYIETGGSWIVERDGTSVALLTDPVWAEMFWVAWKIEPLTDNTDERSKIMSAEYWTPEFDARTRFRSREYGTVSETAFVAGNPFSEDGSRLVIRALYPPIVGPWPWDWWALRIRHWFRHLIASRRDKCQEVQSE